MSLITRMLKQDCVYWRRTGVDENAQPVYDAPIELKCRWDRDLTPHKGEQKQGDETTDTPQVTVYLPIDTSNGDLLFEGKLVDIDLSKNLREQGALEIKGLGKISNLKATESLRVAYL